MIRAKSKGVSNKEPDFAKTVSQAALFLDIGERVLYRWFKMGAPGRSEKGYPIQAIREWRGRHLEPPRRTGPKAPLTGDSARLLKARADEKSAVARLRELELQIASGKYILSEDAKEHQVFVIALFTTALDNWARMLPPSLLGLDEKAMYSLLYREGRALRTRLARTCSLSPDAETPAADRQILEAVTALEFIQAIYQEVFGSPPPKVSCRGEQLSSGRALVQAVMSKIRELKGVHDGQVETESALPVRS